MFKNRSENHNVFQPDFIANSVADIGFDYLEKLGIKAVMIDLDGTTVWRGTYEVSSDIHEALKNHKLKVYIATNRPEKRGLQDLETRLNASGVVHPKGLLGKPFAHYYKKSLEILKLNKHQVAMIGDRYVQDVYGANRAGLTTILVKKLDEPVNSVDRFISGHEAKRTRKLLKKYTKVN